MAFDTWSPWPSTASKSATVGTVTLRKGATGEQLGLWAKCLDCSSRAREMSSEQCSAPLSGAGNKGISLRPIAGK